MRHLAATIVLAMTAAWPALAGQSGNAVDLSGPRAGLSRPADSGKPRDTGLDRAVLGIAVPQRRAAPPGGLRLLDDKAEPVARLRIGAQLRVRLVKPMPGDLVAERADHFRPAQAVAIAQRVT